MSICQEHNRPSIPPHKLLPPRSELVIQAHKVETSALQRDSISSHKFCGLNPAAKENGLSSQSLLDWDLLVLVNGFVNSCGT